MAASGAALLPSQRRTLLLDRVAQHGAVRIADVVGELGVSEMTVRRDIAELAGQGLVERVHGGAVAPASAEPLFRTKAGQHGAAKAAIGAHAAARVRPGETVALSGGSTVVAVARALAHLPHAGTLTVITNSLPAADVLHTAGEAARAEGVAAPTVLLTGGERSRSDALVGHLAVAALGGLHADRAFLGAHGIDATAGLMTPNPAEAATNAAMVAAAREVVAVVDASKWGVPGLRVFCSLEDLTALVTDAAPDPGAHHALATRGVAVEIAEEAP